MEEKSNLEQFLELTELLGNDEMIDPEEEAQFWKSEAGQKMSRAFSSPEHREFLRNSEPGFWFARHPGTSDAAYYTGREGLELTLPREQRTKGWGFTNSEMLDFARQDAKVMEDTLRGGGKYNPTDMIRDKRRRISPARSG